MSMDMDLTHKYRIADIPLDGKLVEIDELIPYKNGGGFLRTVILEVAGVFNTPAYVPITLLGTDATDLDPQLDNDRPMKCTGRISSRRYLDRAGHVRWAVSLTGTGVILGQRASLQPKSQNEELVDAIRDAEAASPVNGLESDPDDIPF